MHALVGVSKGDASLSIAEEGDEPTLLVGDILLRLGFSRVAAAAAAAGLEPNKGLNKKIPPPTTTVIESAAVNREDAVSEAARAATITDKTMTGRVAARADSFCNCFCWAYAISSST